MLYQPGTDGAAVTDVRLHGSRPFQHPELRNTSNLQQRRITSDSSVDLRECHPERAITWTPPRGLGREGQDAFRSGAFRRCSRVSSTG